MVYFSRDPQGYKNLLTWKQADAIYRRTLEITKTFHLIKDSRLIDQMNSSARSGKRNIEEGFKRATTKEYISFLGYAIASLAELRGDYEDCVWQKKISKAISDEMETLLRGEDVMLNRQIGSLEEKMMREGSAPRRDRWNQWQRERLQEEKRWQDFLREQGIVKGKEGDEGAKKG